MKFDKGEYIGRFINEWRRRNVAVYEHLTDPDKVVTIGYPFDGGAPIETVENRQDWTATIRKIQDATAHGRVYRYE